MSDADSPAARPRRSVLYMPGSNPRALEKARSLPADGLILDLEDAVAPDAKDDARRLIGEAVAHGGYGKREVIVRVNGLDTAWGRDDLAVLAGCGCDAILIPKVENAAMIEEARSAMQAHGARPHTALWSMIETPKGVLHAEEIAAATPPGGGFVMGTSDLAKDLQAAHTRERLPMLPSLGLCLLAARAHGLAILDGVHLDLQDEDDGFAYSCRGRGRGAGRGRRRWPPGREPARRKRQAPGGAGRCDRRVGGGARGLSPRPQIYPGVWAKASAGTKVKSAADPGVFQYSSSVEVLRFSK